MLAGQSAHPGRELRAGVLLGVVVDQLGELIVAGVAVAAPAVGVAPTDGNVVVAGDALDPALGEQRPQGVGLGPEAAQVAQAEDALAAPGPGVGQQGGQGVRVGVRPAEDGHAGAGHGSSLVSTCFMRV